MSNKNTNRGAELRWDVSKSPHYFNESEPGCGYYIPTDPDKARELLTNLGGVDYGKARTFEGDLDAVLGRVKELLMAKNAAYGDAALNPLRFHSSASPVEQLNVRMDDKLSRMARGGKSDEDEPLDYVGYWVLREIAKLREAGIRP